MVSLARIEELVERFEEAPGVWVALSRARTTAGEPDAAMAAANRAVELTEGSRGELRATALQQRARRFAANADPQRAVEDLRAAAEALPRAASIRLELARALEVVAEQPVVRVRLNLIRLAGPGAEFVPLHQVEVEIAIIVEVE